MLFCAFLAGVMVCAMLWGRLPDWTVVCAGVAALGVCAVCAHSHSHGEFVAIDYYAQRSRLARYNPALKALFFSAVLLLCVAADSALLAAAVLVSMTVLTLAGGGIRPRVYLSLMTVPAVFILLSGLALVFDFAAEPVGVLSVPVFGRFLCVTAEAQADAFLVMVKALGAISCLYALSLSTPMHELIGVLRRAHLPAVVIELMYLIYRYVFLLLSTYGQIKAAAASRLGYAGWRTSLRTYGAGCANLLVQSFRRAGACFDAMEARCCDGTLAFLETPKPLRAGETAFAGLYFAAAAALAFMTRG